MNQPNSTISPEETRKFPLTTLLIAVIILAAAAAILVFKVPILTVLSYGFLGLMLFGHLFMHAGHGAHDQANASSQHSHLHDQDSPGSAPFTGPSQMNGPAIGDRPKAGGDDQPDPQDHSYSGHSGCC